MEIRVSGKNIDLGEVLRHQAEHRLNEVIRKYVDSNFTGHVTVSRDGIGFKTECAVRFDHGPVMHVTGEAPDAYQSLSVAIERIAKSLRRF
ncbi:MAG: ribosome-associated translation inhibitor RaiA, partial [Methylobacterium sp.]|nr:ribosome-associated translation inhibitor RaiA [Methylobacterium sp.]